MEKLDMLYEGKAKKVYKTADENLFIVEYKDDATAFNGLKKGSIMGKGVINNKMTNIVFEYLEKNGVETHLIKELSDRATLVKKVSIVPLEVIIRNVAAGSFSKKYGVEEGTLLNNPILEFSYKNDDLGDPMINDMQILAIGLA
ncbi:MAG: phosphoribosylaminoimidazolesuccinocarboxamide synthase, partial [Anaerotignaceae bacterium]